MQEAHFLRPAKYLIETVTHTVTLQCFILYIKPDLQLFHINFRTILQRQEKAGFCNIGTKDNLGQMTLLWATAWQSSLPGLYPRDSSSSPHLPHSTRDSQKCHQVLSNVLWRDRILSS